MNDRIPNGRRRTYLVRGTRTFGFLLLAAVTLGCGDKNSVGKLLPVEGTVMVGTEPLNQGTVTFLGDAGKGNATKHVSVGTIVDGKYKMSTLNKDGVPAGFYKVTVHSNVPSNPKDEYSAPKSLVHQKYLDKDATPLVAEVKDGGGPYDFKVIR